MRRKNALIIGIANRDSISAAIARELYDSGYTIIPTYLNEKALPHVKEVTDQLGVDELYPFKVGNTDQLDALINTLQRKGQRIDAFVHGIAFASEIRKDLHEVSWHSFKESTRVSAFSMVEISGHLLDVLNEESSILSISLRWSRVAVPGYNIVGATKAGLESMIRGLAESLGEVKQIRVNGISPGFVPTYSLTKIGNSLDTLEREKDRSPLGRNVRKEDIASFAVSILENNSITSMIFPVDAGVGIMG